MDTKQTPPGASVQFNQLLALQAGAEQLKKRWEHDLTNLQQELNRKEAIIMKRDSQLEQLNHTIDEVEGELELACGEKSQLTEQVACLQRLLAGDAEKMEAEKLKLISELNEMRRNLLLLECVLSTDNCDGIAVCLTSEPDETAKDTPNQSRKRVRSGTKSKSLDPLFHMEFNGAAKVVQLQCRLAESLAENARLQEKLSWNPTEVTNLPTNHSPENTTTTQESTYQMATTASVGEPDSEVLDNARVIEMERLLDQSTAENAGLKLELVRSTAEIQDIGEVLALMRRNLELSTSEHAILVETADGYRLAMDTVKADFVTCSATNGLPEKRVEVLMDELNQAIAQQTRSVMVAEAAKMEVDEQKKLCDSLIERNSGLKDIKSERDDLRLKQEELSLELSNKSSALDQAIIDKRGQTEEVANLHRQIAESNDTLATLQTRVNSLVSQLDERAIELTHSHEWSDQQIAELQRKLIEAETQKLIFEAEQVTIIKEAKQERCESLSDRDSALSVLKSEKDDLKAKLEELGLLLSNKSAALDQAISDRQSQAEEVISLHGQLAATNTALDKLQIRTDSLVAQLDERTIELQSIHEQSAHQISELKRELTEVETQKLSVEAKLGTAIQLAEKKELCESLVERDSALKVLTSEKEDLIAKLNELALQLSDRSTALELAITDGRDLNMEVTSVYRKLTTTEALGALQAQWNSLATQLEERISKLTNTCLQSEQQISKLEQCLISAETQKLSMQTQLAAMVQQLHAATENCNILYNDIGKDTNEGANDHFGELQRAHQHLIAKNTELKQLLDQTHTRCSELEADLSLARNKFAATMEEQRVFKATTQNEKCEMKIKIADVHGEHDRAILRVGDLELKLETAESFNREQEEELVRLRLQLVNLLDRLSTLEKLALEGTERCDELQRLQRQMSAQYAEVLSNEKKAATKEKHLLEELAQTRQELDMAIARLSNQQMQNEVEHAEQEKCAIKWQQKYEQSTAEVESLTERSRALEEQLAMTLRNLDAVIVERSAMQLSASDNKAELEERLTHAQIERLDAMRRVTELEQCVAMTEERKLADRLADESRARSAESDQLGAVQTAAQKEKIELEVQLAELEKHIEVLTNENTELKSHIKAITETQLATFQEKVATLTADNKALQERYDMLNGSLQLMASNKNRLERAAHLRLELGGQKVPAKLTEGTICDVRRLQEDKERLTKSLEESQALNKMLKIKLVGLSMRLRQKNGETVTSMAVDMSDINAIDQSSLGVTESSLADITSIRLNMPDDASDDRQHTQTVGGGGGGGIRCENVENGGDCTPQSTHKRSKVTSGQSNQKRQCFVVDTASIKLPTVISPRKGGSNSFAHI